MKDFLSFLTSEACFLLHRVYRSSLLEGASFWNFFFLLIIFICYHKSVIVNSKYFSILSITYFKFFSFIFLGRAVRRNWRRNFIFGVKGVFCSTENFWKIVSRKYFFLNFILCTNIFNIYLQNLHIYAIFVFVWLHGFSNENLSVLFHSIHSLSNILNIVSIQISNICFESRKFTQFIFYLCEKEMRIEKVSNKFNKSGNFCFSRLIEL